MCVMAVGEASNAAPPDVAKERVRTLAILGGTGDLANRYLLPAMARLFGAGEVDASLQVLALGRSAREQDEYLRAVEARLEAADDVIDEAARQLLLDRLTYRAVDMASGDSLRQVIGSEAAVVYLALPPSAFFTAIEGLRDASLHPDTMIVVEKPFGENLESARRLNALLHSAFPEQRVFRIDHFLHQQTVQNILGLRFANRLFEPLWRAEHVARVDIVWDETLGLEGRAGYYDRAGALRDVIQNHLLQLLALIAMEPPAHLNERDLRDQKLAVLRAVRTPSQDDVRQRTTRARYSAGTAAGRPLPDYAREEGVEPARETETFACVELAIDNWRWGGVPFRLRTGKALGEGRRYIEIVFRPVPHLAFGQPEEPRPNTLRLELRPDRIVLGVAVNGPGDPFVLDAANLSVEFPPQTLPAYSRLLLDVLRRDPTLAIRDDEAEESWRIVDPIVHGWSNGVADLLEYPAGSPGPSACGLATPEAFS